MYKKEQQQQQQQQQQKQQKQSHNWTLWYTSFNCSDSCPFKTTLCCLSKKKFDSLKSSFNPAHLIL